MKKTITLLLLFAFTTLSGWAQKPSISFTSAIPVTNEVGTTLKVNYKYTTSTDTNIYCGINLLDDWTWISVLVGEAKKVSAGTDVEGSFDLYIPKGTKPSANLKDKLNYKINIEMKSLPDYSWIAGDYPATPLNILANK
jgi:hypothetical protein